SEAEAELAADALWQGGPSAVSERSLGDGRVVLTADPAEPDRIDPRWPVEVVEPDGEAHLDAWREWARPARAGRRILLQPAWLPASDAADGDVVIVLDPGRAFGSGSHPSTRMVLAVLEDVIGGGERILDLGCGSGVLGIAACRLGAAASIALDVDPEAVEVTRANAAANGVGDRIVASGDDLATVAETFDVVVANIGVRVLSEIAPELVERVQPGGLLVLAGLLDVQVDAVASACVGCAEVDRRSEDGWSACVLRRTA
ncbi:MAG: 50S ribosomal protein L11 methyltransferase, partial [Acidimicrobiales bacterium]